MTLRKLEDKALETLNKHVHDIRVEPNTKHEREEVAAWWYWENRENLKDTEEK